MRPVLPLTQPLALLDAAQMRALEQGASMALPPHTLMRRAGASVARLALAIAPHAERIWIAAGPGNNGGDGLEAAIHLQRAGKQVELSLIGDAAHLPPDAADALARARAAGITIGASTSPATTPDIAIDALLGVGASRAPTGAIAEAIRALNALHAEVLAIDLPSGLDARTGQALGADCVTATHTLAMLSLKPGLVTGTGRDHAGRLWLDTLEVDATSVTRTAWFSGVDPRFETPRRHAQNKGSFGDVAIVAGATGMSGAALLAARAAHAAGAGRVYVELLDRSAAAMHVDPQRPELMFRDDWTQGASALLARSTVVCGCGGGDAVREPLPRLLGATKRLVLDADALNAIAKDPMLATLLQARAARGVATVMTPHPLEAARLLAVTTSAVQADRLAAAQELAQRFACVVVLKGSGSVIASPNRVSHINGTGNASLATAGTGDVLAGWLGGRWCQQPACDEAATAFASACQAVAEHGAAAEPQPSGSLRAGDLIERLHAR